MLIDMHKTANVLNKLPKSQQSKAKRALQKIWMAETKKDALVAFEAFVETWGVKFDKAVACLTKDRDAVYLAGRSQSWRCQRPKQYSTEQPQQKDQRHDKKSAKKATELFKAVPAPARHQEVAMNKEPSASRSSAECRKEDNRMPLDQVPFFQCRPAPRRIRIEPCKRVQQFRRRQHIHTEKRHRQTNDKAERRHDREPVGG
jgi:transposase-like protein